MVEPSSIPNRKRTRSDPTGPEQARRRKTESEQLVYSSKLINRVCALRRADSAAAASRAVHDAADCVLVDSAKGKTRWSRAMLNRRLKRKHTRPGSGLRKPTVRKKPEERLQRKVRVLSRLIPGCRKVSLYKLVEETSSYIAALEMQVKAMALLKALLNDALSAR